ncbi:MAG: helix-turn-helix transcriptional regulator [Clostridiales bacterium]|nr:helix-turn-helix transcriptional regulator [Clostridiales bacterium]
MAIVVNLQAVMSKRGIGLLELSKQVGITPANMSILKNNRARAVRFSTLDKVCEVLDCQPGDILEYKKEEQEPEE